MLRKFLFVFLISFIANDIKAQIKIGNNPTILNPGSQLELESTNKGFLMTRLTTAQMNSIAGSNAEKNGLIIFNLDSNCFFYYATTQWKSLCGLDSNNLAQIIFKGAAKDSIVSIINNSIKANNGLTKTGLTMGLGGTLVNPTLINSSATPHLKTF